MICYPPFSDDGKHVKIPPIKSDERVAFVGKTGSGKTYAAGALASGLSRLVVVDPKGLLYGEWGLQEESRAGWKDVLNGRPVRMRIPEPYDMDYDKLLRKLMGAGPLTIYLDEVYGVMEQSGKHLGLRALYTRGREWGLGVWAAFQRPRWIPRYCLSEAEWIFCFRLQDDDDRKTVAGVIGPAAREQLTGYQFWMYNQRWERPIFVPRLQRKMIPKE